MIVSLSKRTQFSLCLQSPFMLCLPVHWFGRTLICPGEPQCPACKIGRKKCYWYALATVNKRIETVEFCDSLARSLQDFSATVAAKSLRGIVARGHRSTKRSTWTMDELTVHPELVGEAPAGALIDAVSQLYQLPQTREREDVRAWLALVKDFHLPLLTNCVIPMQN